MPFQPIVPTWLAWNNANFPTASGVQDSRTGQDDPAGGLNLGDYFDATEREANAQSFLGNGLLHSGRYRLVLVDSNATAANVRTGTVGCIRAGSFVQGAEIVTPGTGGTPGTYNIPAFPGSGGGGVGAVLQVVIGANGAIVSASIFKGGTNYTSTPAFVFAAVTGNNGSIQALLNSNPNIVTSYDKTQFSSGTIVRPVVFLNSITPGNFGFIQELGLATVRGAANIGNGAAGFWVNLSTANDGTVVVSNAASPTAATIGKEIDWVGAGVPLFKTYLTAPAIQD